MTKYVNFLQSQVTRESVPVTGQTGKKFNQRTLEQSKTVSKEEKMTKNGTG